MRGIVGLLSPFRRASRLQLGVLSARNRCFGSTKIRGMEVALLVVLILPCYFRGIQSVAFFACECKEVVA